MASYESIFKVNGIPILPPLMTTEKRLKMNMYKNLAVEFEQKLKQKNNLNPKENTNFRTGRIPNKNSILKSKQNGSYEKIDNSTKSLSPTSPKNAPLRNKILKCNKKNDIMVTTSTSTPTIKQQPKNNNGNGNEKPSYKLLKKSDTLIYDVISNTVIIPCEQAMLENDKKLKNNNNFKMNTPTSCNVHHQGIYKKQFFSITKTNKSGNNLNDSNLIPNKHNTNNRREIKHSNDLFNSIRNSYGFSKKNKNIRGNIASRFEPIGSYDAIKSNESNQGGKLLQYNSNVESIEKSTNSPILNEEASKQFKKIISEINKMSLNENDVINITSAKIGLGQQIINLPSNSEDNPKTMILSNYSVDDSDFSKFISLNSKIINTQGNKTTPPEIIIEPPTSDVLSDPNKDTNNLSNVSSSISSPSLETTCLLRSNSFTIDSPSDALLELINKQQYQNMKENNSEDSKMNANNLRETYIGEPDDFTKNTELIPKENKNISKPIFSSVKYPKFLKKSKLSTSDQSIRIKPSPYNVKLSTNSKLLKKHRTATLRTSNVSLKNKSKPSPKSSATTIIKSKPKLFNIDQIIQDFEEKHKIQLNQLMERQKTEQLKMQEVFEEQQKHLVEKLLSCTEFTSDDESGKIKQTEKSPMKDITDKVLISTTANQRRKEAAATKINAYARGYLTRRLMKTKYVQKICTKYNETLQFVIELPTSDEDSDDQEDVYFKARVLHQLKSLAYSLHSIFFKLSVKDKILLIREDNDMLQNYLRNTIN